MCNAYSITSTREAIRQLSMRMELPDWPERAPDPGPRYRVSPRTRAPIVRLRDDAPTWSEALWRFIPPGSRYPRQLQLTNARDDKLVEGWPWKLVSRRQRALILATGFYEPEKVAGSKEKVPWRYYSMTDGEPFFFAGLWTVATDPETGEVFDAYAIVTTSANETIHIHDRMPVILDPAGYGRWLEPGDVPTDLLRPYPADQMQGWRVDDAARSSRSPDLPSLIEPVPPAS